MTASRERPPVTPGSRLWVVSVALVVAALAVFFAVDAWALARLAAAGDPAADAQAREGLRGTLFVSLAGEALAVVAVLAAAALIRRHARAREAAAATLWQSERSYRGLFEGAHDAVLILDPDREVVLEANARAERLYGLPRADLLGRSLLGLSRDPIGGRRHVRATLAGGAIHRFETVQRSASGAEIRLEVSASAIEYHGRPAILSVNRDVTERWRAEEALRASEERFRLLVEGVRDYALFLLDPDGRVSSWNAGAERVKGYRADEILGRPAAVFYPPEAAADFERLLGRARADGRAESEGWRVRRDGTRFWASVTLTALRGQAGEVIGYAKLTRDLTAQKAAQAALREKERFARQVLDSSRDCVKVLAADGRLESVNRGGLELLEACDAGPLLGRPWEGFWEGTARADAEAALAAARAGGTGHFEGFCPTLAGTPRWWDVIVTPLRDAGASGRVLVTSRDVTARVRADEAVRLRDRAIEAFDQGVCIADATRPDQPIVSVNAGFERMTGYAREEVVGRNCRFLQGAGTDPAAVAQVRAAVRAGRPCLVELLNYRKDGTPFWNALSVAPVHAPDGRITHLVAVQTDVTPFKQLQAQFLQAQKMEAVGHLAGGIAHDFNNLLTIINGYAELARAGLPPGDPTTPLVTEIEAAGERAAGLTRQLLAFSRQQVLQPQSVGLNALVGGVQRMLARVIGEDVELVTRLHPEVGTVLVDPGQVEQVLLNLAVNARDAMPTGGRLTVETRPAVVAAESAPPHPGVPPGRYAVLVVTDTGTGMTAEVRARIFEPFFTTKGVGQGTGLGLATVFGIVQQSGGHVRVDSEVGRGTSFRVYLPEVTAVAAKAAARPPAPPTGRETVLLVEDEGGVRALVARGLRQAGYTVLEAEGVSEAVGLAAGPGRPVDLLLTDVVMPGGSGRELAERLATPSLRVLFMSGYTDDAIVRHGIRHTEVEFLPKPFTVDTLLRRVREVLDQPAREPSGERASRQGWEVENDVPGVACEIAAVGGEQLVDTGGPHGGHPPGLVGRLAGHP